MTINKRVREVREAKGLTMDAFGKAIGLSHSGISAIEYETRPVTDKNIKLICVTFGVDESWLRTGDGEMFVKSDEAVIQELAKKHNLDSMDCAILQSYMELPPPARAVMKAYLRTLASEFAKHDAAEATAAIRSHPAFSDDDGEEPPENSEARA